MASETKKNAVFRQLSREAGALSLEELLHKLGGIYSERSVRRWLAEMVQDGLVERSGQKRGTKYKAVKWELQRGESCFGSASLAALEKVRRPLYERTPVAYAEEWFDEYKPNTTFYLSSVSREKLYKEGKRSKNNDPAGTYAHQIFNRLLIDLSYNSSRLEGNTYSLLDTERLLFEGTSAEGKLEEEKIMILNHKEAIRYLVDNAHRMQVSEEVIRTVHYLLSGDLVDERYAGKIRDHGVRIGGSTYVPIEDPERLRAQLERITKKAHLIKDPYEQSLFLLIHISYLQAFTDVNKRTARLCANIPLIRNNLVPLSFNDVEKDDYTSAMIAIYELQDVHPVRDLYCVSYMRACALYDSTVKTVRYDEVRVRYRRERRGLLRDIIVNKLIGEAMEQYISSQSQKLVPGKDRELFREDLMEDLKEIDEKLIGGLGITPAELREWRALL